jgi:hypothetical protein
MLFPPTIGRRLAPPVGNAVRSAAMAMDCPFFLAAPRVALGRRSGRPATAPAARGRPARRVVGHQNVHRLLN